MSTSYCQGRMKLNKYYGVSMKAKATKCPRPFTVTRMLNYKDTTEKHQVQKQAKPLSGLTWQQIPEFSQHKMNFLQHARSNTTGMW